VSESNDSLTTTHPLTPSSGGGTEQVPTHTILVAEDDEFLVRVLVDRLEKERFKIVVAHDGDEALQKLQAGGIELAILDIIMPKKTGFDVVTAMKADAKLSALPVIILSNLGQESDISRAKDLGVADYFVKANISLVAVVDRVRQLLK
jgi:DNA-binding response OmpR family regulator